MHVAYLAVCVMCAFRELGPFCKHDELYPYVMSMLAGLYLVNCTFHHYMHWNKYFL